METSGRAGASGAANSLQFGHGGEAVETKRWGSTDLTKILAASIRPRQRAVETATLSAAVAGAGGFNSATADRPWKPVVMTRQCRETELASIRPRHRGRGNSGRHRHGGWRGDGLQFGHGTEAVETELDLTTAVARCVGFNSATAHRPWKPAATRRGPDAQQCFNSATAQRPWKRMFACRMASLTSLLQFGHGNRPWKPDPPWTPSLGATWLQFGHGNGRGNIWLPGDVASDSADASIRPRH